MEPICHILNEIIEHVVTQKTIDATAADPTNTQFAYLIREMKFSANSFRKGIDSWMLEMKQAKYKSLRTNVKETIADLDYVLDRKEHILDRLHDEYRIAGAQYERSVMAHRALLDQFMSIHTGFIESFLTSHDDGMDHMISTFFTECRTRERMDKASKVYTMNVMHGKSLLVHHALNEQNQKFTQQSNALKATAAIRDESLTTKNRQGIEHIHDEAVKVIQVLSKCLNGRQNEETYHANRTRNEIDQKQIDELEERLFVRKNYLRKLKAKYNRLHEFTTENLTELKRVHDISVDRSKKLQQKAKLIYQSMDDDLKHMVAMANDALRDINKQNKAARGILTMFNVCQKLMAMHERVQCRSNGFESSDVDIELDAFWHEVGVIGHSVLELEKEYAQLHAQNGILQNNIRQFMSEHKVARLGL